MKKELIGKCKFCGQEKKLIKAHIVPKGFYIGLKYDRYLFVNVRTAQYKYSQQGGYDNSILCADCDNHVFGDFDKEGYRVLLGDFFKYKFIQVNEQERLYKLTCDDFDYQKLRKFFISILWRASISKKEEWSSINLGGYEKKAFEILTGKRENEELFKILIYKNSYVEGINKEVVIAKGKTKKYKKYLIQMAGYRIEVMVDSSRITNQYKSLYEPYFLNSKYLYIIETPDVSKRINKDYNLSMSELYSKGVIPPKPKNV